MTKFNRDDFNYGGGYLMYSGDAGSANEYYGDDAHPTRVGKRKELFVARFKYCARDKAGFLSFLIKNFTPEEYFTLMNTPNPKNPWNNTFSPATILEAKGYISATVKSGMKKKGYSAFDKNSYRDYFEKHVSSNGDCGAYWKEVDEVHAAVLKAAA